MRYMFLIKPLAKNHSFQSGLLTLHTYLLAKNTLKADFSNHFAVFDCAYFSITQCPVRLPCTRPALMASVKWMPP